ncbi:MAG: hypothetical protein AAFV19_20675 [Pseudomonadota bacterium]
MTDPDVPNASPMTRRAALSLGAGAVLCAVLSAPVAAQSLRDRRTERRQQRLDRRERRLDRRQRFRDVRDAVGRGEIRPLREVARTFQAETGAEIVNFRHRKIDGQHFYLFKALSADNRLGWYVVNAATLEIMTEAEARSRYGVER